MVYALSLGQTEASLELIIVKLPLLSRELILDVLQGFGFAGKPTKVMIAKMQVSFIWHRKSLKGIEGVQLALNNILIGQAQNQPQTHLQSARREYASSL